MIIGIGIDLVSINDFSQKLKSRSFIGKVFTETEIAYCESFASSSEHFAGKFAAKEAFMKAIGKGIQQGVWFQQIEVKNKQTGAPSLAITRQALEISNELGVAEIHLSISHSDGYAVALVILETAE